MSTETSAAGETETDRISVRAQLMPLMFGFFPTQGLHTLARLGVADLIGYRPATADRLAAPIGAHTPSLYRLLRAAVGLELLTLDSEGRFRLTERGQLLRTGTPGSVRGRERTQAEFAAILSRAGLCLDGVLRCAPLANYSVLRAVPSDSEG
ncbi:MAG: hypothetical protein M3Z25_14185 [Actinomycetota bacterium]|nr:hypothetical protein [Actinomycetota bacterium]